MNSPAEAPLQGIRVIELARVLAGPWVGQTLADLGATVLKVESPKGDETREWGPPYVTVDDTLMSAYFLACNRGKQSLTIDFHDPAQLRHLKQYIAEADIVIENFKVGSLQKFGLDYATLKESHPRLIYCSISGFGQDGPYAQRPGYDYLVQGISGIMDVTGHPEEEPQKIGVAFSDIFTGLYSVIAIQAALWERQRSGLGQQVDMSLLDCMVGVLANQGLNYLATGVSPKRMGNAHPNIVPYATFPTRDDAVIIAVGNDPQFARLCQALELPALAQDPRYETNSARVQHRETLSNALSARTQTLPRDALIELLTQHGVPAAPVNSIAQMFDNPQIQHRQMHITPEGTPGIRNPIRFSRSPLCLHKRAPKLGETGHR